MRVGFNFASFDSLMEVTSNEDLPILQFYTHLTKDFSRTFTDVQMGEIQNLKKTMYVHSTFNTIPGKYYSKKFFEEQFRVCKMFGVKGIIVHIPNISIAELVNGFKLFDMGDKSVTIYLEHVPGEYGASAELMCNLYDALVRRYSSMRFGICIDTCHVYASGINLSDISHTKKYIEKIETTNAPILLHLNDSHNELGTLIDRHAPLGTRIWTPTNYSSLEYLLTKPWDAILEMRPPEVLESINFVKKIQSETQV